MSNVALRELTFAVGRTKAWTAAQHEQELVDAVMEVIERLRLPREELVETQSKLVAARNKALDVEAPSFDRG
jgi:hypothetical protein